MSEQRESSTERHPEPSEGLMRGLGIIPAPRGRERFTPSQELPLSFIRLGMAAALCVHLLRNSKEDFSGLVDPTSLLSSAVVGVTVGVVAGFMVNRVRKNFLANR